MGSISVANLAAIEKQKKLQFEQKKSFSLRESQYFVRIWLVFSFFSSDPDRSAPEDVTIPGAWPENDAIFDLKPLTEW